LVVAANIWFGYRSSCYDNKSRLIIISSLSIRFSDITTWVYKAKTYQRWYPYCGRPFTYY